MGKSCFESTNCGSFRIEANSRLKQIGEFCFSKSSLDGFMVPRSVETLGKSCFSGCQHFRLLTFEQRSRIFFRLCRVFVGRICPMEYMGEIELYHSTQVLSACQIVKSQTMIPGWQGNFGRGIYFAATPEIACGRATATGAVLKAKVNIDLVMVVSQAMPGFLPEYLKEVSCGGLKGMPAEEMPWEFVVYESWRITNISKM
jgi:hypothetical protein